MEADYNREVYFRRHMVQPPGMVYVTVDDVFVLKIFNPSAAATVNVSIRYLDPDGNVIPQFQQFSNVAAQSTARTLNFRGSEGYVLSATISTPGASSGAVYVQLEVGRGLGAQDITEGHLLIAGYPGSFAALGYPQTQPLPPTAGVGVTRTITPSNPAAGADWSVTVPVGATWVINSVTATFTASAGVANRNPQLQFITAGGAVLFSGVNNTAITASQAETIVWWNGAPQAAANANTIYASLMNGVRVPGGGAVKVTTLNLQAGDQWSNIVLQVQELVAG
jgi:hypothetical protein